MVGNKMNKVIFLSEQTKIGLKSMNGHKCAIFCKGMNAVKHNSESWHVILIA